MNIYKLHIIIPFMLLLFFSCSTTVPNGPDAQNIKLKILSYNIYGYNPVTPKRTRALINTIVNSDADIITLQEANDWFLEKLKQNSFISKNYYFMLFPTGASPEGKVYTLSKYPIINFNYYDLPSRITRKYLVTNIKIDNFILPVVNVHLESPLNSDETRIKQMKIVMAALKHFDNAIIAGDFNFGDQDELESRFLKQQKKYSDLWKVLSPTNKGFTWNKKKNNLALKHSYPDEPSRRLDRILIKSRRWKPVSIKIIGQRTILLKRKKIHPSDHFGLLGEILLLRNDRKN